MDILIFYSAKFDISIPEELKYVLVSDWDLLTHKKSLFSLPAKITVATILSDYTKNAEKLATGNYYICNYWRLSILQGQPPKVHKYRIFL